MSRVDEDRDAARLAEKLMLEKRDKESRVQAKQQTESAFSKKVAVATTQQQTMQKEGLGRSAIATLIEAPKQKAQKEATSSLLGKALTSHEQTRQTTEGRVQSQDTQRGLENARGADNDSAASQAEGRHGDAKVTSELLEKRGEKSDAAVTSQGFSEARESGGSKDSGAGSGGQDKKKEDKPAADLAAGFRFNPALMAPVPIAKPRDMAGSERLRALASEIAQKIVESARVGTNAAGKAEFQIDLRSNVLSGLSIKVSGSNGKIRAVFSGNDREVLKLLKEQGDVLKNALTGRGLVLEEFKIEERR